MKKLLLLSTSLTACSFLSFGMAPALANPEGGVVSSGTATINTTVNRVDVTQSTDKAVIDWRSFNINNGETTQFHQPTSSSLTVNRINDANPSQILGTLKANGNIVLINQSGISFGKDAVVDVGGLIATTSDISNVDAMNGNMNFINPGNATATISNAGTITAKDAGLVGLVAPNVENSGVINARLGKVHLASGDKFTLDLYGDGAISIQASDTLQSQIVSQTGNVNAQGGVVQITAAAGANLVSSLVQVDGELSTASASVDDGGKITISGNDITNISITGTMDASGTNGGDISLSGHNILQQGQIKANGTSGAGGSVNINFKNAYLDNEASTVQAKSIIGNGGTVNVIGDTGSKAFISGQYDVSSTEDKGGQVNMTAAAGDIKLFGAKVTADGATGGGTVNIGGEFQGGGTLAHANTTSVNYSTILSADATNNGKGGEAVVWSDQETQFGGTAQARGGVIGGDGGQLEISSKDTLKIAGNATTIAAARADGYIAGNLLLDPKNLTIEAAGLTGGLSYFELVDPNADAGYFALKAVLSNGNVVVVDYTDDLMATDSGAVYLFNGSTGALISTATGSQADDKVGYGLSVELTNGNYVFVSQEWDDGGVANVGAVTFLDAVTGLSGVISSANSLVGSTTNDLSSFSTKLVALTNGNYVVVNPLWDNGAISDAGAATWGDGTTGVSGVISTSNSLYGTTANDRVGLYGYATLTNGNYIINSPRWDNGAIVDTGAVTWGDGTTGISGAVSAANSLVGSSSFDQVGSSGVVALANGNYVVSSPFADNGAINSAGAVTWGNGTTGISGAVSTANSLMGGQAADGVGYGGVIALANGDYLALSPYANNGAVYQAGGVTWGDGTTGITGVISTANSLMGSSTSDRVGTYAYELANGNYVVASPYWDNGAISNAGALTWIDAAVGTSGVVSVANSLVGSTANDGVGNYSIIVLSNGNYLVRNPGWDNGAISDAGAVTWVDGTLGISGVINASNSLVGTSSGDQVGSNVKALTNGNYVVGSTNWDNGAIVDVGAATWGDGTVGISGVISAANSLVGSTAGDKVGTIQALTNGNYVVGSVYWDNGAIVDAGAATWGDGTTGVSGVISVANSLVGSTADDQVGAIQALTNGNYVVGSVYWDNGAIVDAGFVAWANGTTGISGAVSSANALVGSTDFDYVGEDIQVLSNGNYIVESYEWDNGIIDDAGAVTIGNGTTGVTGEVTSQNSILGTVSSGGWDFFEEYNPTYDSVIISNGAMQKVYSVSFGATSSLSDYDSYSDFASSDISLNPAFITDVLDAGTSVTLQANNDITLNDDLIVNNAVGDGGTLTFQAGRSILLNADITTDDGDLNLFANEDLATGVVDAQRDAGDAVITMAAGSVINAGTGSVNLRLDDGAGKTNSGAGDITLRDITAGSIFARNMNTSGDVVIQSGTLTANNAGDALTLVSARNFINNSGAGALSTPSGRWLVYSTNAASDVLGGLSADFILNGCVYGGSCPALLANNGFLYSFGAAAGAGSAQTQTALPDTVKYMSLGGFLRDQQEKSLGGNQAIIQEPVQYKVNGDGENMTIKISYANDQDAVSAGSYKDASYIALDPWLKEFLSNPFAMLME